MDTSGVFDFLRAIFTYAVYPAVILTVFAVIGFRMKTLLTAHQCDRQMQWRLTVAGLLPITVLTFVGVGKLPHTGGWLPGADQWLLQLVAGALITVATLELSQRVSSHKQVLVFTLYLGTLGAGLLYVLMEGELARFQSAVFAVVVVGGLHFVFRERKMADPRQADEPRGLTIEEEVVSSEGIDS